MQVKKLFSIEIKDYYKFIVDKDKYKTFFELFGALIPIKNKQLNEHKLYIVAQFGKPNEIVNATVTPSIPFQCELLTEEDLVEAYYSRNMKTPRGGTEMFDTYKVTNVEFGEVNEVALEVAIEDIAKNLPGVVLKKKRDKVHLVKDGSAVELNGAEFKGLIERYMKDKTVAELRGNTAMYGLITKLGLLKKVTLEKSEGDLSAILG